MAVEVGGSTADAHSSEIGFLRVQLTNLPALLLLSILMTESADDEQILCLEVSAASALGAWRIAGFAVEDIWRTDAGRAGPVPSQLAAQLPALPETGQVGLGWGWAWAYPLRSIAGPIGHMVACAACEPTGEEQFLAQVVAQQTLKYRLQRIRELTGFDLADPETRFNLELATRTWVTLQALRG
jgi:PucR C-terminal helix-turn-helix domain